MMKLVFFLFSGAVIIPNTAGIKQHQYQLIDTPLNWTDAQIYCRENYTDLVTIRSETDLSRLPPVTTDVWIGLSDDPGDWRLMESEVNSWRWSTTEQTSPGQYQMWEEGQPDFYGAAESCVMVKYGTWRDVPCELKLGFVCFNGSTENGKHFSYITLTQMNWTSSRDYCRAAYTDLAHIENQSDQRAVQSLILTDSAWIGLYRAPWRWSDGSASTYRNWSYLQDNWDSNEHCAVLLPSAEWADANCNSARPFICQAEITIVNIVKMDVWSEVDLSDSAANAQFLKQINHEMARAGLSVKLTWSTAPKMENPIIKSKIPSTIICEKNFFKQE